MAAVVRLCATARWANARPAVSEAALRTRAGDEVEIRLPADGLRVDCFKTALLRDGSDLAAWPSESTGSTQDRVRLAQKPSLHCCGGSKSRIFCREFSVEDFLDI